MFKLARQLFLGLIILFFTFLPLYTHSTTSTFPKTANYYLHWKISPEEAQKLAQWDVLILDMEVQENSYKALKQIKKYNPNITILAYITSQEIIDLDNKTNTSEAFLRTKLYNKISPNWWLKDSLGEKISFWSGTWTLNLASNAPGNANNQKWNEYLPEFVSNNILNNSVWDGVFYDNVWPTLEWLNSDIDINGDGQKNTANFLNKKWKEGVIEMLKKTQTLNPQAIIVANGDTYMGYQPYINGMMFEGFPSPWEGDGTWGGSIKNYLTIGEKNKTPKISIINSYQKNQYNYQKMRFGLTSSLLGNGYYSYDYDISNHGQLWRYDEYKTNLGQPETTPYNLLSSSYIKNGLWRRDFNNGVSIVNSTNQKQTHVFEKETFEKIEGTQDRNTNDGTVVNWVELEPKDGIVLLKREEEIKNNSFTNGVFVRSYNQKGEQIRNGFFAYKNKYPGNSQIIIADIDNQAGEETLVNYQGKISIYKNGQLQNSFSPYDNKFGGDLSFAVADLNGDGTKEIITGAGPGGGPHVRVFSKDGTPLIGGFFAYEEDFRGGVNLTVLDLNGDGTKEIITGAGPGGGPHVRVFSKDGTPLIGGFFAYDRNFTGGVNLTVGDVTGNNQKEIITGSGLGGAYHVKIYTKDGDFINDFKSYENEGNGEVKVMAQDINNDGIDEILAGNLNF